MQWWEKHANEDKAKRRISEYVKQTLLKSSSCFVTLMFKTREQEEIKCRWYSYLWPCKTQTESRQKKKIRQEGCDLTQNESENENE